MSTTTRRPTRRTAGLLALCFALALAVPNLARGQGQPAQVVVFGDSLSDPGNGFFFLKSNSTPPDYGMNALLIPNAPYAIGGHHLTNGSTWIEQLAAPRAFGRSVMPAFAGSSPYAMNFAIGTARARQDGMNPSLALEVGAFLQKSGGVAPADALYVVQIGGNDVRDALTAAMTGNPQQAGAILQAAADAIATSVGALYGAGARRFLVWNVPNVGLTPTVRFLDAQQPGTAATATFATGLFNTYVGLALSPLSALPGISLVPFDAASLIAAIVIDPAPFGLTNVTDACVTPGVAPFTCQAAGQYLFWDGIHPTRAAHAIFAEVVALLLGL